MGRNKKIYYPAQFCFWARRKCPDALGVPIRYGKTFFFFFFFSPTIAPELNDLVLCTPQRSWCCSEEGL
jgi:hypothetical protein